MTAGITGRAADSAAIRPGAWIALSACLIAVFMQMLDLTIVHTAVPALALDLRADGPAELLIVSVYGLTFACTLPTAARLGDLLGRYAVFTTALSGFAAASVWCGTASSAGELALARGSAGVAAALVSAQTIAILTGEFPERMHATVFGVYGAVAGLAGMAGPLLGGALVDADAFGLGWRTVFLINIPLAGIAMTLARRQLATVGDATDDRPRQPYRRRVDRWTLLLRRLDIGGAVLSAVGLGLLIYPLTFGRALGWPPITLVLLGLSIPVLAVFGWGQYRRARGGGEPLVRLELFGDRGFAVGAVLTALFYGVFTALLFTVSVAVQSGLGWSASRAGLVMLPFAVGAVAGALSSPILMALWGTRALTVGVTVFAVALGAIASTVHTAGPDLDIRELTGPVLAAGAGMGWFAAPLPAVMLARVVHRATGSASGIVPTVQQIGSALGVAVLGTVFFAHCREGTAQSYLTAITAVLWIMAALSALLAILTFAFPRRQP
ncbi:MFS transporter [Nocardia sp. NPDC058058]|uniref:MFS transporter n=1 Tax=Nocardia sp. NPDC058058 TaxID=3346317 RepID=UPI0036D933AD